MSFESVSSDAAALPAFLRLCGEKTWKRRLADLDQRARAGRMQGRAAQARHALEIALAKLTDAGELAPATAAERKILFRAREAVRLAASLPAAERGALRERIAAALSGDATLIPIFHLLRLAALYRARGFDVRFDAFARDRGSDLVIARDGAMAEVVCETISAEELFARLDRIR